MTRNILIIGGTGVFGKRLVRHLSVRADTAIYVSSRSRARAEDFIRTLAGCSAALHPVGLERQKNLQFILEQVRPVIVIDCSGPFQGAGFDTARAVLQSGAHLIDLADARDYLAGFTEALDHLARTRGVTALTGASSTPTLSTCVAMSLTKGWQRVDTIDISITPGGRSEVGRAVIEAILSYAGRDIPVWRAGRLMQTTGWFGGHVIDIPDLGRRRVAAVETFDAEYLGSALDVQSRVAFYAGLESRIEQCGIELLAALRKRRLIKGLERLIPLLLAARRVTRIPTSDRGGMMVCASGLDQRATPCEAAWILIARDDHGPNIPILPAAAAVEKLIDGSVPPGARLAHSAIGLADITDQMTRYRITTDVSLVRTGALRLAPADPAPVGSCD